MPPKIISEGNKSIFILKVTGGVQIGASYLAPKVGPLGVSPKRASDEICRCTSNDWKGIKVNVKLTIENRLITSVEIVPSISSLLTKALKETHSVYTLHHLKNLKIEEIKKIAEIMFSQPDCLSHDIKGCVLQVLGTANSLGITIGYGNSPLLIQKQILSGDLII